MNNLYQTRLNEDDILSSGEFEECRRLQNSPDRILYSVCVSHIENDPVLRLSEPETNYNKTIIDLKDKMDDSLESKMSHLAISSPIDTATATKHLGIITPRLSSTLTITTNHPLMSLGSPDESYPDIKLKQVRKTEDEKELSLSSIEDDRNTNQSNEYFIGPESELYRPQRNTSKNNLYFSENVVTADSKLLNDSLNVISQNPRIEQNKLNERRKIIPLTSIKKIPSQSTPVSNHARLDISEPEEYITGVSEWCESPSHQNSLPNFNLPIEMSSDMGNQNELETPDAISTSTQEDKSAYQALLDPYTGSVVLRHTTARNPVTLRRKIQLPPEGDEYSLDSISGSSMESENEPPEIEPISDGKQLNSEGDDIKRSKSTTTLSDCSDPIPEYSAAEELRDERSWLVLHHSGGYDRCDLKVIEPYKRVLSHGGYDGAGAAIMVLSACYLPDTARPDYRYVMHNLFLYVIYSLDRLVTEEYILVYLHGSAGRRRMPTFGWLHKCYNLISWRLKKSVKHLFLVHPTFWLKSFVVITKTFVSSKFYRKLSYVRSLSELLIRLPLLETNAIPEIVKEYDASCR